MAKNASVRLSATGGRQVKAELEGVGEAGTRGFGRLSREMERANARLAGFARRARVAMAAAAAAIAAAATGMIRSGLQVIDSQAKLAAALDTTVASIQVLERAAELSGARFSEIEGGASRLTRRLSLFVTNGGGPAATAIERLGLNAEALLRLPLDARIDAVTRAIRENAGAAEQAALFSQLFGDRAFTAFQRLDTATLEQANQDLRDFGAIVSDQDAAQIERTNDAISRLGLVWRGLSNQLAVAAAPALEAVADAMAAVARTTGLLGRAIQGLFDNLGRLTSYAAGIATLLAGRFVAAKIAAAASVRGLAMALVVLRGALRRLPIVGLVVAAGELVHGFGRLVRGAGGLGNALSLLGDLAREVWDRMQLGAGAMGLAIMARWAEIRAAIAEALQASLDAVVGFGNAALNTFQGAFEAIKVLWGALPSSIGEFAFQAANALITGVEAMLNGVGRRINGFLEGINAGLEALGIERRISLIGDLELGRLDNPFEGAAAEAGAEAREAFEAAFQSDPIAMPDLGLGDTATEARGQAEALRAVMSGAVEAATAPLESIAALREAVAAAGAEAEGGLTGAGTAAAEVEDALDAAGDAAGRAGAAGRAAGGALREGADAARGAWEATADAVRSAQERSREIAKGLAQDITGPIKEALKSGEFTWQTFASAVSRIAQNLANRLIEAAFKPIENALISAFSGGGGSGGGRLLRAPLRLCARRCLCRWAGADRFRPRRCGQPAHGVPLCARGRADGRGRARGDPAAAPRARRAAGRGDEQRSHGAARAGDGDADHQRARPVGGGRLSRHAVGRAGHPQRHPPQPECAQCLSGRPATTALALPGGAGNHRSAGMAHRCAVLARGRAADRAAAPPAGDRHAAPPAGCAGHGAGGGAGAGRVCGRLAGAAVAHGAAARRRSGAGGNRDPARHERCRISAAAGWPRLRWMVGRQCRSRLPASSRPADPGGTAGPAVARHDGGRAADHRCAGPGRRADLGCGDGAPQAGRWHGDRQRPAARRAGSRGPNAADLSRPPGADRSRA